ncbi:MAG: biotin--[acetyl-CoA-carboxylase] ligase [Christensenellaceae bacterium]|nr:biotin--[acetyl-CoA-carboxylase] ligase [Christensenellaceae bacterium]
MSLKQNVLYCLNNKEYISGQNIADTLNVSRAAVWKAIQGLIKEGYKIEAVTNKGYKIMEDNDVISVECIKQHLKNNSKLKFEYIREVDSTNNLMKERFKDGVEEGYVIVASLQTKGKGRLGRSFYSPEGSGIYMSILLKPDFSAENASMLTAAAAVAVVKAIDKLSNRQCQIKWVNDIYLNNKKVCGILSEASYNMENRKLDYVIVGIGINVYEPDKGFPEDIKNIASQVFLNKKGNMRNKLIASVCEEFFDIYNNFESKDFVKEYQKRNMLYGKDINIISSLGIKQAKALDIDDNCHLKVQLKSGEIQSISSGEVSVKEVRKN